MQHDNGESRQEAPRRSALPLRGPDAEFYSLYPDAPLPRPAREVLPNALPLVAVQRCPPITTASSLGWVLSPAVSFAVRWSGDALDLAFIDDESSEIGPWSPIIGDGPRHPRVHQVLEIKDDARRAAAEQIDLAQMPLIDPSPFGDPREFQYLSGIVGVTAPGWAMLVRSVPNWPRVGGEYEIVEGVVETAWSGTVLPVMVRLRSEGSVARFTRNSPMAVIHPVAVAGYAKENAPVRTSGAGIDAWSDEAWDRFVLARSNRTTTRASYRALQADHYREGPPSEQRD